jgi:AcrR family transcriptional regulator
MEKMTSPGNEERASSLPADDARERVISTAYDLFTREGVRGVGIDRIISEAGVAKMTLYRHFPSKDELALAVIDRRKELWTWGWIDAEMRRRSDDPVGQLLAIFDILDDWFHDEGYESCVFIGVLREFGETDSPLLAASREALADVRTMVIAPAREAGIENPEEFAFNWQVLMSGAIVCADMGYLDAAKRAGEAARLILSQYGLIAAESG